jgi:hypothetical protein
MPEVLPPSPEASSISKAAQLSVSKNTGAASVSIPIYEIKLKGYSLPISLDYNTNGTKVDEIPGRVGLNWSLNAGGVVTRVVHGKPDDLAVRATLPTPANFDTLNNTYGTDQAGQNTLSFLENATYSGGAGTDTEPDEFRISAPGISVKFIIDLSGNIIQFPYSNVKIQVFGGNTASTANPFDEIIVTNTDGTKYTFGGYGAIETTISHGLQRIGNFSNIRTGFFLKKIESLNGEKIDFNYTPISIYCYQGVSHGILISLPVNFTQSCPFDPPAQCATTSTVSETINGVGYQTVYLSSISISPTKIIDFGYENRPDNSGDKRLKQININYSGFSRVFYLGYEDPQSVTSYPAHIMNTYNKRFFLKEFYYLVANGDTGNDTLRHKFEYNNVPALPPRLSYAQDHYGFFNGAVNINLLPAGQLLYNENVAVPVGAATADRSPNGEKSAKGALNKIIFPAGGFEEFEYEPNYYGKYEQVNTTITKTVSGSGNSDQYGSYISQTFYTETFNILFSQTANLSLSVYGNPGCTNCTPPPMNTMNLAKVEVFLNGAVVYSNIERNYTTSNFNVLLSPGYGYSMKLTIWGLPNAATAQIAYDYSNGQPIYAWANYEAGGVRVKKVSAFDPVSSKTINTYYKYAQLDSLSKSSGVFEYNADYKFYSQNVSFCGCSQDCELYSASYLTCNYVGLASNSNTPIYLFDNNHIGYTFLVESNDPDFKNGATEYQFEVYPIYNSTVIMGYDIKNTVPSNTVATSSGYHIRTSVYTTSKKKLKESKNYYNWGTIGVQQLQAYSANRRYTISGYTISNGGGAPIGFVAPTIRDRFKQFDLIQYTHVSSVVRLDSTIEIDFDTLGNSVKTKITYNYGALTNILPVKTESNNSLNELITTEMKYPTDYSSSPYTAMVSKNIITPVIETKQKRGATEISLIRNNYKQWYSSMNSTIFAPEYITARKGSNTEETRIRYYAYDETGNPLDVSKENGGHVSYIWDYNKDFPIAEFKNASILTDSIAYTSFEADGKGCWNFSGTPQTETSAPMGSYAYNLTNGNITRSTNSLKTYFVTYWLKNGSGTINVNGSASKILINRNGWTCYEHLVLNPLSITINGTGIIDELRLYPVGSYIISFSYNPYVGIKSRNEPNNQISYYEYDAGLRLKLIRDGDKNIIKQFDYQYKKQIYPCASTAPNWVVTGQLRCQKTTDHTNNNTGLQEQEKRDMNNCSPTYLQTTWVSLGNNGQCPPVANCTGPDKRVINGICTTGWKVLVSSQQTGASQWLCTYHYVWSDGYVGANFTETSSTSCGGSGGPE